MTVFLVHFVMFASNTPESVTKAVLSILDAKDEKDVDFHSNMNAFTNTNNSHITESAFPNVSNTYNEEELDSYFNFLNNNPVIFTKLNNALLGPRHHQDIEHIPFPAKRNSTDQSNKMTVCVEVSAS